MHTTSIAKLLESRGAWLKGASHNHDLAQARLGLTRQISENYPLFEQVRDRIFHATESFIKHTEIVPETLSSDGHILLSDMLRHGLVLKEEHGHEICEAQGRRYLSGGWLEELAWLAAQEAGAHECLYGQAIGCRSRGFRVKMK